MRQLIFIAGMHRSGTSLIARAVETAGACLGNNLMGAAQDNPKGFAEDLEVFEFNERLLDALDTRWDVPTLLLDWDPTQDVWQGWQKEAGQLLKAKSGSAQVITLKDPRFSLLAPIWISAAEEIGFRVKFVLCLRHPVDVAHSLESRDGFGVVKGLSLWLSHNYSVIRILADRHDPCIIVRYEYLLDEPDNQLQRLIEFVGVLPRNSVADKIAEFSGQILERGLCHSRSDRAELMHSGDAVPYMSALYSLFEALEATGWDGEKARQFLKQVAPQRVEAFLYSVQRHCFPEDIERAMIARTADLEKERELALRQFQKDIVERELALSQFQKDVVEMEFALNQLQKDIAGKENDLKRMRYLQEQTDRHLNGVLHRVEDMENSLSYKIGRGITWPIRIAYDLLILPFRKYPENVRLAGWLVYYVIRHPLKALRLLRWAALKNAWITFFRSPGSARSVVSYYGRMMHGSGPGLPTLGSKEIPAEAVSGSQRISVVVVNYNGRSHLPLLIESLLRQDYDDYEIILVDNGSLDGSVEFVQQQYPSVRVVALTENLGFAEGNDVGAEVASGDYYCLVNNDAATAPDFLSALIKCIQDSHRVAAAGAKMLFWKKFVTLDLKVRGEVLLDEGALSDALSIYPKWFLGPGWKKPSTAPDSSSYKSFEGEARADVAVCKGQEKVSLRLRSLSARPLKLVIETSVEGVSEEVELLPEQWTHVVLDFTGKEEDAGLRYLINNAGTWVNENGDVGDRGFAEPDEGQFDQSETVDALCGGAMLIRRTALRGRPLFSPAFFAYFEDTELSLRLRRDGYELRYCPAAVLYHKHASTSNEYSPFFRYHVQRNRFLFLAAAQFDEHIWRSALEEQRQQLNHLHSYYQAAEEATLDDREFGAMIPALLSDWDELVPRALDGSIMEYAPRFPKMAVYNNFWHTLGGGEHHACIIAQALTRFGPVELISENDFEIGRLERQFDIDLRYCRKRIVTAEVMHHDPSATGGYDLFINSTYGSDLPCHARHAFYVVSFPYQITSRDPGARRFLADYVFLANSQFTQGWVRNWWSRESKVLYPSIHLPEYEVDIRGKHAEILHVGRFFLSGHNKKQLELVQVFKRLWDAGVIPGWSLTLVGQVADADRKYLEQVEAEASGYPINIYPNAPLYELRGMYRRAAVYWHATGLGEDPDDHPELNEHFGITTVEAMAHGCVPIVIDGGGQPEIVQDSISGFTFVDEGGLESWTLECTRMFEEDPDLYEKMSTAAITRSKGFSRQETKSTLIDILEQDGFDAHSTKGILN